MELDILKEKKLAPEWLTESGLKMLEEGYLFNDETPKDMWMRVSSAAASRLKKPKLQKKFFDLFWNNWLCAASPVLSNMGTSRGLPISCYSLEIDDSVDSIFMKQREFAMLSKNGGGIGIYGGNIRGRGTPIKGNGESEGIIPWAKCFDTGTKSMAQGETRRGASAMYIPIDHLDIEEFLQIRRATGDLDQRCQKMNHGICVSDEFLEKVENKDPYARNFWKEILKTRIETGEPYLLFIDNANRQVPDCYKARNLKIKTSNICNEIYLYTDSKHTFVCCLSSMNLLRYDEWKDTDAVQLATWFLDAVMEEFIGRAKELDKELEFPAFASAIRFATKSRALGLGVLGWHSLLQSKGIAFDSMDAMMLNGEIFKKLKLETKTASMDLAKEYGEPEWCKDFGIRNTHTMAVAPTASNSIISGSLSAGIEPWPANIFTAKTAKGSFLVQNSILKKILSEKGKDNNEIWRDINDNNGSVQHLKFLTGEEKEVFLTAREINQFAIIKQAGQRQKYIDQGQSVNLFFSKNLSSKYLHQVHMEAWKAGLKGLYYSRTESVIKGDSTSRQKDECKACEG